MRNKTLLILTGVFLALVGLTAILLYTANRKNAEIGMGKLLFEKLDVNEASVIKVRWAGGEFAVARKNNVWQVEKEGYDYPADFDKVTRFLRGLTELKVGRSFAATPERIDRLTLASPADSASKKESRGALFIVTGGKGDEIVRILVGKEREGKDQFKGVPQGQFVIPGQSDKIYLVDRFFEMDEQSPSEWMDKALVSVDGAEIKTITARATVAGVSPTTLYELSRSEKGKEITAVTFPADKKAGRGSIQRLSQFLSALACDDASKIDPSKSFDGMVDFTTFAGVTYRVGLLGPAQDGCLIRLQVFYGGSDKKTAETAQKDNDRFAPWVYKIGKWRCDSLAADPAALEEKAPARPEPGASPGGGLPPGFDPSMFGAP